MSSEKEKLNQVLGVVIYYKDNNRRRVEAKSTVIVLFGS